MCDKEFKELKWRLTITLLLVVPDNSGGIKVYSYALSQGLRRELTQSGRVSEFASR